MRLSKITGSLILFFVLGSFALAQTNGDSARPVLTTSDMSYYSPYDFYMGRMDSMILNDIPENKVLSAQNNEQSRRLMNFLLGEGVTMGFGTNPNRDSFFDLYGYTSVDVEVKYPAPQFGQTVESEGGRRYFPDHDAAHLWALRGIGPRLSEIATPEKRKQAINSWAKLLMDAEALATAYNSAYQVKEYWNFRFRQEGHSEEEIRKFEAANRAVLTIGNWTYESYMDVVLTNVRGELRRQHDLLKENVTYDLILKGREAKVPELFPSLSERFSPQFEKWFFKYAFAPLFSVTSLYRPINGYHALMKSTIDLLEYYYSPYYVRWADMFKIGEDIETASRKLEERIALFKKDNVFGDVVEPAPGRFETQQIRNMITQQGRKLIELEELAKLEPQLLSARDRKDIKMWLERLVQLNDEMLSLKERNATVTPAQIENYRKLYAKITASLITRFPVETYIPASRRLGYANYENFWNDPYSLILDRKIVLTKFVSAKGIWQEALKARFETLRTGNRETVDIHAEPHVKVMLEQQLAYVFNRRRSSTIDANTQEIRNAQEGLNQLKTILDIQFQNFDLQIKEYQHLDWSERVEIVNTAKQIQTKSHQLISRISELIDQPKPSAELFELEAQLKTLTTATFQRMQKMLAALDLSSMRVIKAGITDASISHIMNLIVDGLGTPFKWNNIKTIDPNLKSIYKFHLNKLKSLTETQKRYSIASWWKNKQIKNEAKSICSMVSGRCVDREFMDKIAGIDLVDRQYDAGTPKGKIKEYKPIRSEINELMHARDQMRGAAAKACRQAISL